MPNREKVVGNESCAGHQHETAANPERMGATPENLPCRLGMATDSDDSCGVKAYLRFQHCRDFQQVVSGWIEKQKTDRGANPDDGHHPRDALQVPKSETVVPMGQKPANHHHR